MVELEQVSKTYRSGQMETVVLRDCSLIIPSGSFAVVLGVSGSGKTTLLNLIGGIDSPTRGSVRVAGRNLAGLSARELTEFRRETVGFVFQFYNLLPTLTARENVEAGVELLDLPTAEVHERAMRYLDAVGLATHADKFPAQLSGGEQQRVAIARALAKQPKLLLADEPTGNLDTAAADDVVQRLRRLQRETGTTVITVTHSARLAEAAELVIHIVDGVVDKRGGSSLKSLARQQGSPRGA